jgi:hypothetical protein
VIARGQIPAAVCRYGNAVIIIVLAVYFFLVPGMIVVNNLRDPALRSDGIARCAFRWHRALTPKYERWARDRVSAGSAANLGTADISGTEWPLFGSVFYLWATESLQEAWEDDNDISQVAPGEYASGAIEAAAALVADPNHATWVKEHWGEDYLRRENLFYRELLIAGLTSHYKLLGDGKYLPLLRDQVESLSRELDESPHGLLDDYPGQSYPMDVVGAIAGIQRADSVLGTDHSAFVKRAVRGFTGELVDSTGLPAYEADSKRGQILDRSRGCGDSFILIWAPELWQETARQWYADFEEHFWKNSWMFAGFREFPKDVTDRDWHIDVDSGPVLAGYGAAASAFGVGAARANGRFDHAYPLTAEMLVTSWPLLNGTLLVPRILSNAADAPYLGEAGILFCLTRQPVDDVPVIEGGRLPGVAYTVLLVYFGMALVLLVVEVRTIRRLGQRIPEQRIPAAQTQFAIWTLLLVAGIAVAIVRNPFVGLILVLLAQFLPQSAKPAAKPAR